MNKIFPACFLTAVALIGVLSGCAGTAQSDLFDSTEPAAVQSEYPLPDGDPNTVFCKASYTGTVDPGTAVASVGSTKLTAGVLQAAYALEVNQYRQESHDRVPDFAVPLDQQLCPLFEGTWQQYFLAQALQRWQIAAALQQRSQEIGVPTEDAYQPDLNNYAEYMTDIPATNLLAGYNLSYHPNTMHQAYLDNLDTMLEALAQQEAYLDVDALSGDGLGTTAEALEAYARLYNFAYMYFTELTYWIESEDTAVEDYFSAHIDDFSARGITPSSGNYVTFRSLLLPSQADAEDLLKKWRHPYSHFTESVFADFAYHNSLDTASALFGGLYQNADRQQLPTQIADWCFDSERTPGDYDLIPSSGSCYVLYYCSSTPIWYAEAKDAYLARQQENLLLDVLEAYPMEVNYRDIVLTPFESRISLDDLLYPDVAHERFPQVPLYLQQDYKGVKWGNFELRTNGCGITTYAMLASYMTDTYLSPPMMCERFWRYSFETGTDGTIFAKEGPAMGFFIHQTVYNADVAKADLQQGHPVVVLQQKGYWTRGGHYLLLEKIDSKDRVQVRDSNIFNYGKLDGHKIDSFAWDTIPTNGMAYWSFEKKQVTMAACTRCGVGDGTVAGYYLCPRCIAAVCRRDTYLNFDRPLP